jgi:putative permease
VLTCGWRSAARRCGSPWSAWRLAIYISHSLLVIFGALVFAAMIDGGARLLGRALKIDRLWRVLIVLLGAVAFTVWLVMFAGQQISREAAQFPAIIEAQANQAIAWLDSQGFQIEMNNVQSLIGQALSGFGTVTRALGGILGGLTTLSW